MRAYLFAITVTVAACGPSTREGPSDPNAPCDPGAVEDCYSGQLGTENVGPCHGGQRTCSPEGIWSTCAGEVVPAAENCADGIDNNCSGSVDEDVDLDGDGITTCGGDCCDSTECADPAIVNSGAFDAPGNNFDDDCNGVVDDATLLCDSGIASNTNEAMDFARAIELCQTTTLAEKKWGVISAKLVLANGSGTPAAKSHSVRPKFGDNVVPRGGTSVALLSTGAAAGRNDTNPTWEDFQESEEPGNNTSSPYPADFVQANGGTLPNAPGCAPPDGDDALDPVMLELEIRVPSNAKSFTLDTNFFSSEFPEWTCSAFNDFFVVLLDSTYQGNPANPADKNLAFYSANGMNYPVGVNLAAGDTGLFTQCINGELSCADDILGGGGQNGTISTCTGVEQLAGTGFDINDANSCDSNSKKGGGTGWLQTSGNVVGGEVIKLRIAIWDTSDHILDSLAVIDHFQWSVDATDPGTVLF